MEAVPKQHMPLILLGGASGSGKSYLAHRFGRPHVELDNFYRELSENTADSPLPQTGYGEVDWDHSGTWNCDKAVDGLVELLETGQTQVPNYSISTSSYDGTHPVELADGPLVAEGIFVSEVLAPLRELGIDVQGLLHRRLGVADRAAAVRPRRQGTPQADRLPAQARLCALPRRPPGPRQVPRGRVRADEKEGGQGHAGRGRRLLGNCRNRPP